MDKEFEIYKQMLNDPRYAEVAFPDLAKLAIGIVEIFEKALRDYDN